MFKPSSNLARLCLVILCLGLTYTQANAQNLIVNPSFESFNSCPGATGEMISLNNWLSPTDGSPDYFNSCSGGSDVGVPLNYEGNQAARTGNAYVGIKVYGVDDVREYVSSELALSLQVGQTYCLSFYVNKSDFSQNGIANLSAYFSVDPISVINSSQPLVQLEPQISWDGEIIQETTAWVQINGTFTADLPYQYITIGNFLNNADTEGGANLPGTPLEAPAYYYIDDVELNTFGDILTVDETFHEVCNGETLTFTADGGDTGSYEWYEQSDPSNILSTSEALTITSQGPAIYVASAEIGNCRSEMEVVVNSAPIPVADFSFTGGCPEFGASILITGSDIASTADVEWDFGNDGTIDSYNSGGATFLVEEAGMYEIKLIVKNNSVCVDSLTKTIEILTDCNYCEFAPNLVPNHSWEEYSDCPLGLGGSTPGQTALTDVPNWYQSTSTGTFDYFNTCYIPIPPPPDMATSYAGVPSNSFGEQTPNSGLAYGGFYAYVEEQSYREYASIRLRKPLLPGVTYCGSMVVSLSEVSEIAVSEIGMFFSTDSIAGINGNLPFNPQIVSDSTQYLTDTNNWTSIYGEFTPQDTLHFMTLGNFKSDSQTDTLKVVPVLDDANIPNSYYFVDDITLFETPTIDVETTLACVGEPLTVSVEDLYCDYVWTRLSDGEIISNDPSFVLEPTAEVVGEYTLQVNALFCTIVDTFSISLGEQPVVSFEPMVECAGEITSLINSSQLVQDGALFQWDINGDGVTDTTNAGTLGWEFMEAGSYTINLVVVNPAGCSDASSATIVIPEECDPCDPQNLVTNSSFEFYNECPSELAQIDLAHEWTSFTNSPADLFNGCAGDEVGVPENSYGDAEAFNGDGYAGILAYNDNNNRSYLTTELIEGTTAGQQYCVSMRVHLAQHSGKAIDKLGAFFYQDGQIPPVPVAQVVNETSDIIFQDGWQTVTGLFTPGVSYDHIAVGNFYNNGHPDLNVLNLSTPPPNDSAYYYIDEVVVSPVDLEIEGDLDICQGDEAILEAITNLCEHQWSMADSPGTILSTEPSLTFMPDSTTTFLYTGGNDICQGIELEVTVVVFPQPELGGDVTICPGSTVQLSDESEAATYSWEPADQIISGGNGPNPIVEAAESTTFTVTVTYDEPTNCPLTDEITVFVADDVYSAGSDMTICDNTPVELMAEGGSSYEWSPAETLSEDDVANPTANPEETTTYTVEIYDADLDCTVIDQVTVFVEQCDDGGPEWVDENGDPLDGFCTDVFQNESVDIDFPDFIDPDLPNESFEFYITEPSNGEAEIDGDKVEYNPNEDFIGSDSFDLIICDNSNPIECDTVALCININEIPNNPPTFVEGDTLFFSTFPDSTLFECLEIFDEEGNENDEITIVQPPVEGEFEIVNGNCFEYIASPSFVGTDSVLLSICDELLECDTVLVYIDVLEVPNTAPMFADGDTLYFQIFQDSAFVDCPDIFDAEDNLVDSLYFATPPVWGVASTVNNTCFQYWADDEYLGWDSMIVYTCDIFGLCDSLWVYVEVLDWNIAPVANDMTASVFNNTETEICFEYDDADLPLEVLTVELCEDPTNGTVTSLNDSCLSYLADPGFLGLDQVALKICDDDGLCDTLSIEIIVFATVTAVDDTMCVQRNVPSDFFPALNDIPATFDELTVISGPSSGEGFFNADGSFTYNPQAGFQGDDLVTYSHCSSGLSCDTATIFIQVGIFLDAVNDFYPAGGAPVYAGITSTLPVINNDIYPDLDSLSISMSTPPTNGTFTVNQDDFTISYTADITFTGVDEFTYVIFHPLKGQNPGVVTITVEPNPNITILAVDDDAATQVGDGIAIDVLANDLTIPGTTVKLIPGEQPANGIAVVESDFNIFYQPDNGYVGMDSLRYILCTFEGASDTAWVFINVSEEIIIEPDCLFDENGDAIVAIPSGISPNGDGKNEQWEIEDLIQCEHLIDNTVTVVNRYGSEVFYAENYGQTEWWNGTWKNEELPVGTYFYFITVTNMNGEEQIIRGPIEVFR